MNGNFVCVTQGSVLGPFPSDIFSCDLFMFLHDISVVNYVDDNTPYFTALNFSNVLIKVENAAETQLQWFKIIE